MLRRRRRRPDARAQALYTATINTDETVQCLQRKTSSMSWPVSGCGSGVAVV